MQNSRHNFILIGMMGSGKTTIGKALAGTLGFNFKDTDMLIESDQSKTIKEIVELKGIDYFRDLETDLLNKLAEQNSNQTFVKSVISSGGGIVLRKENHSLLKSLGKIVWLKAKAETIVERIKNDTSRPLIEAENETEKIKKIKEILNARSETYHDIADIIVEVEQKSINEIINLIISSLSISE
ncbi:MAG: shikimate kinase [Candidatus Melainabacteria bacterium]|jgi:shikimate kinase